MAGWPFKDLAARIAGEQNHCLDWDPAKRLSHVRSKRGKPPFSGGGEWVG
ncbi:hypothetical protein AVEN_116541-1, partial [Araneus ventricosus]